MYILDIAYEVIFICNEKEKLNEGKNFKRFYDVTSIKKQWMISCCAFIF